MAGYYFADISTVTQRQYRHWLSLLPEFRRNKALGYRRYEDSLRSVIAYLLLWRALERQTGSPILFPEFRYNENGKPYLKNASRTLDKPFFSLSHTDDFVACALSKREIGVDAQQMIDWDIELARKVCTTSEWRIFENVPWASGEKSVRFTGLWTLKESYLKAIGTGLSTDPTELDFCPALSQDLSCDRIDLHGKVFQIQRKTDFPETILTLCRHPESDGVSWQRLNASDLDAAG